MTAHFSSFSIVLSSLISVRFIRTYFCGFVNLSAVMYLASALILVNVIRTKESLVKLVFFFD
jgi:hypothetical protein